MNSSAPLARHRSLLSGAAAIALGVWSFAAPAPAGVVEHSVARQWNDALLEAIRNDNARPVVHARNLYHTSLAMWDAWATYSYTGTPILFQEDHTTLPSAAKPLQEEAMSYAMHKILRARFGASVGADEILPALDQLMIDLGYDPNFRATIGNTPGAVGNRIAITVLAFGLSDNANEQNDYVNQFYEPVNPPLLPDLPGNPDMVDPDRWQPLALDFFIDQSGNPIIGGFPEALGPEWGQVTGFALKPEDLTINRRDGFDYWLYHDPGPPPSFGEDFYKETFELVAVWSSHLDPADGVMWDISPGALGGSPLPAWPDDHDAYYNYEGGGDWAPGLPINPATNLPYDPQIVPRGDYARVLAEFWADGPDSETPPGHWFSILNYVNDHPLFEKRLQGQGPLLDDLEWDVKAYLIMGGAMHDSAITAWGAKGWYDYLRPISALRYMADLGQSSDPLAPSYHPDGIPLRPNFIEVVTAADTGVGGKMEHLAGEEGKIAFYAWRGPDFINDPETDVAGVDWILAENWWPYQRPTFVTPPFPGYVSGHSTFSRCAARTMDLMTGSPFFPGGLGEFLAPQNQFLVFEEGPSVDVTMQWGEYDDASDQTSLSRIWGGIHPSVDDIPGRYMGEEIAPDVLEKALGLFGPQALWEDLGNGLPSLFPAPTLEGAGALAEGETIALSLMNGWPENPAYLFIGLTELSAPFKGGILVPTPDVIVPFVTSGNGEGNVFFEAVVPLRVPGGAELFFQFWVEDPTGVEGFSASNALKLTAP